MNISAMKTGNTKRAAILALALAAAGVAHAGPIPYPDKGKENPVLYSFSAAADGDITAYFLSKGSAWYTNVLTMLVNGVASGVRGLNNQTAALGASLVLGSVHAGDSIVFEMINLNPGTVGPWYSDKSMNSDGLNHVYSTNFLGNNLAPAGTYVAFEDQRMGGDFNYNDLAFVFTNISTTTSVPEPGSLALVGVALAAAGVAGRKRARS